jgi:hypothetical protein
MTLFGRAKMTAFLTLTDKMPTLRRHCQSVANDPKQHALMARKIRPSRLECGLALLAPAALRKNHLAKRKKRHSI